MLISSYNHYIINSSSRSSHTQYIPDPYVTIIPIGKVSADLHYDFFTVHSCCSRLQGLGLFIGYAVGPMCFSQGILSLLPLECHNPRGTAISSNYLLLLWFLLFLLKINMTWVQGRRIRHRFWHQRVCGPSYSHSAVWPCSCQPSTQLVWPIKMLSIQDYPQIALHLLQNFLQC